MGEAITKEELMTMMQVQAKSTEQMVIVATRLQEITNNQTRTIEILDKVSERLHNGMAKDIENEVNAHFDQKIDELQGVHTGCRNVVDKIGKDISFTKIVVTGCTGLIGIALLVTQVVHWLSHSPKMIP